MSCFIIIAPKLGRNSGSKSKMGTTKECCVMFETNLGSITLLINCFNVIYFSSFRYEDQDIVSVRVHY